MSDRYRSAYERSIERGQLCEHVRASCPHDPLVRGRIVAIPGNASPRMEALADQRRIPCKQQGAAHALEHRVGAER
jgi:hypothetical protein